MSSSSPPAKSPKRRSKPTKTGPTVSGLIVKVVSTSSDRGGMSLVALKKALLTCGYDAVKNKARVCIAVRRLVAKKCLLQTKGTGATGSFKINKKAPTPRKKTVVKKKAVKKPRAKKVKRASAKKAAGDASPGAKKSPIKKKKAKSPKKAKTPAAAKKPKSPRKVKRGVAKSTRAKAAAKKK